MTTENLEHVNWPAVRARLSSDSPIHISPTCLKHFPETPFCS